MKKLLTAVAIAMTLISCDEAKDGDSSPSPDSPQNGKPNDTTTKEKTGKPVEAVKHSSKVEKNK